MSVNKIGIGTRVGKLTVIEATGERKSGYTVWKCRCDCGGEICLDTRCLQRGTVRDCGCESRVAPGQKDVTGRRFGLLTAERPVGVDKKMGSVIWHCRCDCGGEVDAPLHQLTAGYRVSCGCKSRPPLKDWIGKRFGSLTVTAYAGKQEGMHQWRCLCDCGKETVVGQTRLLEGRTRSCGCLQTATILEALKLVEGTSITRLESNLNRLSTNNTSGCTGVYFNQRSGKWVAEIRFKGQYYYLGSYSDKLDAVKARRRGEEMHIDFIQQYYEEQSAEHQSDTVGTGKPAAVGI